MPACRKHGIQIPCRLCFLDDLPRLEAENIERMKECRKDLHDVEGLKKYHRIGNL